MTQVDTETNDTGLLANELNEARAQIHALKRRVESYRALVENIHDVIFALDIAGRFTYVSPAIERLTGHKGIDLVGLSFAEFVYSDDLPALLESFTRAMGGADESYDFRVVRGNDLRHVRASSRPTVVDGAVVGLTGVLVDTTEGKRAEEALRESEAGLRKAQAAARMGSWTWHIETNRLEWSDEMYRIFGIDKAGFSGDISEVVSRAVHPEDRHIVERANQSVLLDGKPTPAEYRVVWPDKSERVVWAQAADRTLDAAGNLIVLSGYAQDITERRCLENELHQAQKMESVGRLAGGVAHDFNNMLGVILGHTEMALESVDAADPLHADLQEIRKAATRSAALTRQLLAFARKQTATPRVHDLNEIISGVLKMLQRLIGEDIDLSWKLEPHLWPVKVDASQIDQILANLCVNARDAIADVGKVTIETGNNTFDQEYCATRKGYLPGSYVRLVVSDDGCGMDEETQSHLFEPFFTTKGLGTGTGLGLATVYGIVTQNNGFITVRSQVAQGTTFTIFLPRHVDNAAPLEAQGEAGATKRGKETILLVEDEPVVLKMTSRMLQRQGYTVLSARTAGEAMRLAQEHSGELHLLMTDVVMPEMNGRDLARNLLSRYPGLKRLFMSGHTPDVVAVDGVLEEGVHFLQKPFLTEELAAKVREALERQ